MPACKLAESHNEPEDSSCSRGRFVPRRLSGAGPLDMSAVRNLTSRNTTVWQSLSDVAMRAVWAVSERERGVVAASDETAVGPHTEQVELHLLSHAVQGSKKLLLPLAFKREACRA